MRLRLLAIQEQRIHFISLLLVFFCFNFSSAYTVTNLSASYSKGQVFLTWTNVNSTNLQYNVYRSTSKFTQTSQLTSTTYLGYVHDSSGKNIRISQYDSPTYYRITDGGTPLAANKGLYVVTCTDNQPYYYAVTVTNLADGTEDKTIVTAQNSLSSSINETVGHPAPVYQYSETWSDGEVIDRYVQFTNNQATPNYPALNSIGSYGFNFYVLKRGTAAKYPVIMMEEGIAEGSVQGNGLGEFDNQNVTNCYIMGVDDWLPMSDGNTSSGDKTNWCGFHEDFNIYSINNPIPTTGTVKLFTQERIIQIIRWAKANLLVDTNRVYVVGNSAGGYGAELTALLYPNEIAAVYSLACPFSVNTDGDPIAQSMLGTKTTDLNSDYNDWRTGDPISTYDVTKLRKLVGVDEQLNAPLVFDVHGRNDQTIQWNSGVIKWYDSLKVHRFGGVYYWDGRDHHGVGADFLDSETTPDFFRYATNISYPAFNNCTIDQDAGEGNAATGAPVGAINGYLDWSDDIKDKTCHYTITVFVKDFYVGGNLFQEQYDTCHADITFRRLQNFHPAIGSTINWKNIDVNGVKIQKGSFVYNGGLITLPAMLINKSGNTIKLKIPGCSNNKMDDDDGDDWNDASPVSFLPDGSGYKCDITLTRNENVTVAVYDLLGRMQRQQALNLSEGTSSVHITVPSSGIYLVKVNGEDFSVTEKILF